MVDQFYNGLKDLNIGVIWSLKGDIKLPPENDNFYISPWCPQPEILAHP